MAKIIPEQRKGTISLGLLQLPIPIGSFEGLEIAYATTLEWMGRVLPSPPCGEPDGNRIAEITIRRVQVMTTATQHGWEAVVVAVEADGLLDVLEHPNQRRYPGQRVTAIPAHPRRADSKYQQGLASGWRLANASSAVMS